jgi:hypothetical protein
MPIEDFDFDTDTSEEVSEEEKTPEEDEGT